jgi:hypothetical protein
MKKDQREKKGTFTRYVFFLFLKFIFYRICIPPPKKMGGVGLLLSVRLFVRPVCTPFRLSNTRFNFARTGVSISEL